MRKVALSLMLAASMAATTLGSTAVFASDATTTESESYTYRYALADFPTNWSLHDNQTQTDSELMHIWRLVSTASISMRIGMVIRWFRLLQQAIQRM